ncbi:MAG: response regulator [Candidatus Zixiibacteriota bacterium]|nr:MAG: response regulator [candidate division Zixibacteria bacterium]
MARILVIDDSPVMRQLLEEFLAELGHDVTCTEDGAAGIEAALQDRYDLCICDIHMPKKNGLQVFHTLSAKCPHTRFILTDSMPDELSAVVTKDLPVQYLRKPFELKQLQNVLDRLLQPVTRQ